MHQFINSVVRKRLRRRKRIRRKKAYLSSGNRNPLSSYHNVRRGRGKGKRARREESD
jgi:hypothetical protein